MNRLQKWQKAKGNTRPPTFSLRPFLFLLLVLNLIPSVLLVSRFHSGHKRRVRTIGAPCNAVEPRPPAPASSTSRHPLLGEATSVKNGTDGEINNKKQTLCTTCGF